MSEAMVERVGEHVLARLRREWGMSFRYDGDLPSFIGRAAIEAMREPTRAMQKAGEEAGGKAAEWTGDSIVFDARKSWPAMIDAALNQKGV